MRPALSAIPDAYMELALGNNGWLIFVSMVAVVIHGMQIFERAMIRLIEALILWPFIQIRRTVYHSDSLMVEYSSASSAGIFMLWVLYGRDNSVAHQLMTQRVPEYAWIIGALALCLAQFTAIGRGTLSQRSICCIYACGFWTFLTIVLLLRVGFSLAHVFSMPLMLACWLAIFILLAKGGYGPTTPTVSD